jgi:hypothetical protein
LFINVALLLCFTTVACVWQRKAVPIFRVKLSVSITDPFPALRLGVHNAAACVEHAQSGHLQSQSPSDEGKKRGEEVEIVAGYTEGL